MMFITPQKGHIANSEEPKNPKEFLLASESPEIHGF